VRTRYTRDIAAAAAKYGLEADVFEAQAIAESDGQAFSWNPEPKYHYLWDVLHKRQFRTLNAHEVDAESPPPDFPALGGDPDQEWWGQQASWGLYQVMGAVARERGFRGVYLPELCDALTNIEYAARHVRVLLDWADGDIIRALCAYNGGRAGNAAPPFRNQAYADRVLMAKLRLT
jgi:soluble lytic murein transglycosylase-like protein